MKSYIILQLFLYIAIAQLFGQSKTETIKFIDSTWAFTSSDTIQEEDGYLIKYYDSLSITNENFEIYFVGQDDLDSLMNYRRKQRVLQSGLSYAIDFYNGKPVSGGYGNGNSEGSRKAYIQWHETGELQLIVNYLLTGDTNGVKDGLSIWFDDTGKIEGYEMYSRDILIFKSK